MAFHNFFPGSVKRIAGREFILGVPDAETGFYTLLADGKVVITIDRRTLMDLTGGDDVDLSILGFTTYG
ncbi:hypothetical protein DEA98_16055 [Brucella pseudogrignonensis]|uniref:Uncharacterized protein n=1 Tax=Brucella pseudogrignonensis TaxID=419475 RepID=A0A7Y3T642_9HYPH|nr:hypothetical protein [Brucella pseudogrignonensis]MCM0752218.1 hypothetical protein [Brucella pseudogrignonensis]NNV19952.1 hypothetical protein [Brucella pseudogrignonensis]